VVRTPAYQSQGSEFKSQYHQKTSNNNKRKPKDKIQIDGSITCLWKCTSIWVQYELLFTNAIFKIGDKMVFNTIVVVYLGNSRSNP
jgi:hypothetical protein